MFCHGVECRTRDEPIQFRQHDLELLKNTFPFGVHIESTVHEFVPNSRIGWWGLGTGMKAYHTFLLVKTDQGCHIITEEVVRGEGAIKFRQEQPNAMHDGHDLWLKVIKERSEDQN